MWRSPYVEFAVQRHKQNWKFCKNSEAHNTNLKNFLKPQLPIWKYIFWICRKYAYNYNVNTRSSMENIVISMNFKINWNDPAFDKNICSIRFVANWKKSIFGRRKRTRFFSCFLMPNIICLEKARVSNSWNHNSPRAFEWWRKPIYALFPDIICKKSIERLRSILTF